MKSPILGASYVARSVNAAADRCINLFPEAIPAGSGGKEAGFLNRAPGLKRLQTVGPGPIRALWSRKAAGPAFFVVSGNNVYKLNNINSAPLLIGNVSGTGKVSIADNGNQIFFACDPDGYIYNDSTGVFQQITDPNFPGASTVAYLDGYFVFSQPDSQTVWVSQLLDGLSVDPLDYASAEGSPDNLVAVHAAHRELWMFGTDSVEVWYDAGATDFPLARISGTYNEKGCVSKDSIAVMDNSLWWLGNDARGQGIVYRTQGYQAVRVSTHAIEYAIAQYDDISDAIAYTYQQEGHSFYVLTFPSADATWVFDVASGLWHQRAGYDNGVFTRHRSNCQCNVGGTTVVGDYQTGDIYEFDLDVYSDNGKPQKWLRAWRALPTGTNNLNRTAQHTLQLDCQSGVGTNVGQGSNPQAMLRWSDDGGHKWSNEHWKDMGRIGETGTRVVWYRLGMTTALRDRVYEVSGTDPVKVSIMGAQIHLGPTSA